MSGIFSMVKPEASTEVSTEASDLELVLADSAFDEATEIAREAEAMAAAMASAIDVGEVVAAHESMCGELLQHPEMVNAGTVALARESMVLAMTALGGSFDTKYTVSREDANKSPVAALEVTTEGVKETGKKIVETIKLVFKKLILSGKKLMAKIIVAMDGTGKKAEKLLKSFEASKGVATESKLDEKTGMKLVAMTAGAEALASGGFTTNDLGSNINALVSFAEDAAADLIALRKAAETAEGANETEKALNALKAFSPKSVKYRVAKAVAEGGTGESVSVSGGKAMTLSSDQLSALNLGSKVEFYPTHAKGAKVFGIAVYAKETSSDATLLELGRAVQYKPVSVKAMSDSELESAGKEVSVMSRSDIIAELTALKGATKEIEAFSKARLKEIDSVDSEMAKAAKDAEGYAIFNRMVGSEFNQVRVFVASTHLSSIMAMASWKRAKLAVVAKHMKFYGEVTV